MRGQGLTRLFPNLQIRVSTPERLLNPKRGIIAFSNRARLRGRPPYHVPRNTKRRRPMDRVWATESSPRWPVFDFYLWHPQRDVLCQGARHQLNPVSPAEAGLRRTLLF